MRILIQLVCKLYKVFAFRVTKFSASLLLLVAFALPMSASADMFTFDDTITWDNEEISPGNWIANNASISYFTFTINTAGLYNLWVESSDPPHFLPAYRLFENSVSEINSAGAGTFADSLVLDAITYVIAVTSGIPTLDDAAEDVLNYNCFECNVPLDAPRVDVPFTLYIADPSMTPVPEPGTFALLLLGLLTMAQTSRRKRQFR